MPVRPGSRRVHLETSSDGRRQGVVVTVTKKTKMIANGVRARVVRDFRDGGLVDRAGSFEAGVDGAQAGIAMPADPVPGPSYRQEFHAGEAEDRAAVITVGEEQVEAPFGHFAEDVLMTRDLVPTEPEVQELKFYAPGVGQLLAVHTDGPGERAGLISPTPGG